METIRPHLPGGISLVQLNKGISPEEGDPPVELLSQNFVLHLGHFLQWQLRCCQPGNTFMSLEVSVRYLSLLFQVSYQSFKGTHTQNIRCVCTVVIYITLCTIHWLVRQ